MARGHVYLWRIATHTPDFSADDMTGGGAKATGGRWNRKGMPVVYSSTSIALATLETLVHRGRNVAIRNAFLVRFGVPARVWKLRDQVEAHQLDVSWIAEPAGSTTIELGTRWLAAASAPLLLVPSVIVPEEYNALINPAHPAAAAIKPSVTRQFIYEPRL